MFVTQNRLIGLSLALVLLMANMTKAEDWPKWLGERGDSVWNEAETISKFPELDEMVKWRAPVKAGYTGPSVAEGRVYLMDRDQREATDDEKAAWEAEKEAARKAAEEAGKPRPMMFTPFFGNERILCLDEKTGKEIWSHDYECKYQISYHLGPRTTPTVDGNHVYTLGAMGKLICFKAADGEIVWQKDLMKEYDCKPPVWGYSAHLVVDGEKLICLVGGKDAGVVAFNKNDGSEIWKALDTQEICYAPPVFHQSGDVRQMLVWYDVAIASLNPETGEVHWSCEFPKINDDNPIVRRPSVVIATPRIVDDTLYVSDAYSGSLMLKLKPNAEGFEEMWSTTPGDMSQREFISTLMTAPIVKDGYIYGINANKGEMRCLDAKTGETKWETRKPSVGDLEGANLDRGVLFATSFIVENNDKFFIFNDQGYLIIAKLSPEGYEELDRLQVIEPTDHARGRDVVWSHPAFANGCMFVRNDKEMVCIDLRKNANPKP